MFAPMLPIGGAMAFQYNLPNPALAANTVTTGTVPIADPATLTISSPEGPWTYHPPLFPSSYLVPPSASQIGTGSGAGGFSSSAPPAPGVPLNLAGSKDKDDSHAGTTGGAGSVGSPTASTPNAAGSPSGWAGYGGAAGTGSGDQNKDKAGPGGMQITPFGNTLPLYPMRATYVEVGPGAMVSGHARRISSSLPMYNQQQQQQMQQQQTQQNQQSQLDQLYTQSSGYGQGQGTPHMGGTPMGTAGMNAQDGYRYATPDTQSLAGGNNGADDASIVSNPLSPPIAPMMLSPSVEKKSGGLMSRSMSLGFNRSRPAGGGFMGMGFGGNSAANQLPRPKNNLRSTNSTFITRVHTNEHFAKLLSHPPDAESDAAPIQSASTATSRPGANASVRQQGGYRPRGRQQNSNIGGSGNVTTSRWAFFSVHRSLVWIVLDPNAQLKEPLMRMHFSSSPTAHTVCETTKVAPGAAPADSGVGNSSEASGGRLDLLVGFAGGDFLWIDPILGKYSRLNKAGVINNNPVMQVRFHPTNPYLFYALHSDGLLFTYSIDRDDPPPGVITTVHPWNRALTKATPSRKTTMETNGEMAFEKPSGNQPGDSSPNQINREDMFVWTNEEVFTGKTSTSSPWANKNPLAVWKIAEKRIKQFEFSPDGQVMAVACEDGTLRLIDVANQKLLDIYEGYFGGLTCLAWSPDGKYVLTGGQDDLITIFSPREGRIVARGQGHSSFVTGICFDRKKCNGRSYRFVSTGEDGKVILWDFSAASLQRPRAAAAAMSTARRMSLGSTFSLSRRVDFDRSMHNLSLADDEEPASVPTGPQYHPAPLRNEVKAVESTLLTSLNVYSDCMITTARNGMARVWAKPRDKNKAAVHRSLVSHAPTSSKRTPSTGSSASRVPLNS